MLWSRLLMFPFSVWPRYTPSCLVNDDLNWFTDLFLGFSSTNKPSNTCLKTSLWNCNAQASRTSCFLRSTAVVFGRDSAGRASIVTSSSCPAFFFHLLFDTPGRGTAVQLPFQVDTPEPSLLVKSPPPSAAAAHHSLWSDRTGGRFPDPSVPPALMLKVLIWV